MSTQEVHESAQLLIDKAIAQLLELPGFSDRPGQAHLAHFLSDLIAGGKSSLVEAPTGLGKSLAALIPAIAQAIVSGKKTVIATYTNVLAEQYWRKDLPLALSLFEDSQKVKAAFLIGRQRYICRVGLRDSMPNDFGGIASRLELGIDTEFRSLARKPSSSMTTLMQTVSVPPVCPARLCPEYDSCWFYEARRKAERANIIITNHSVVLQDALNTLHSDSDSGMLGNYDYLILDEGHDFIQAAQSGLEFDLSNAELRVLVGIAGRIETSLLPSVTQIGEKERLSGLCDEFRSAIASVEKDLAIYAIDLAKGGILKTSPPTLAEHPAVKSTLALDGVAGAEKITFAVSESCDLFLGELNANLEEWDLAIGERFKLVRESIRNYCNYIQQLGSEALALLHPDGITVSYVQNQSGSIALRSDTIGLSGPLNDLIWSRKPHSLISATLATDQDFSFIKRTLGCDTEFEEILASPFDFASQAAVYVPPKATIMDPSYARQNGIENDYFQQIADQLSEIIVAMGGRTLALFHSRREMEAVNKRLTLPPGLPVLLQTTSGTAYVGQQFKEEENASLFGLRSFWTGFDAPGVTLSCVAIVRIPFEVPVEPPSVTRMAHLAQLGQEPFSSWSLPMAKMLLRQGAGRLIRQDSDRGIIAILDPRVRTKRYGEELLANLPSELRTFSDLADALGHIQWDAD